MRVPAGNSAASSAADCSMASISGMPSVPSGSSFTAAVVEQDQSAAAVMARPKTNRILFRIVVSFYFNCFGAYTSGKFRPEFFIFISLLTRLDFFSFRNLLYFASTFFFNAKPSGSSISMFNFKNSSWFRHLRIADYIFTAASSAVSGCFILSPLRFYCSANNAFRLCRNVYVSSRYAGNIAV
jgi:hypothetical protein